MHEYNLEGATAKWNLIIIKAHVQKITYEQIALLIRGPELLPTAMGKRQK